jgi:pimeloyl-ACP methyl ester carboxylesterase
LTQAAYNALVQRLDPGVIILTHSQGGNFGLTAALDAPARVRAVISLEPSGAPDPGQADPAILKNVPHLFIWGDNWTESEFWVHSRPACERWREALSRVGCDATFIDLPKEGIHGNSHAFMDDNNSDEIAGLVIQWMTSRGLLRS